MDLSKNNIIQSDKNQTSSSASFSALKTPAPSIRSPAKKRDVNQMHDGAVVYTKSSAPILKTNEVAYKISESYLDSKPMKREIISQQFRPMIHPHLSPQNKFDTAAPCDFNLSPKNNLPNQAKPSISRAQTKGNNARVRISFQAVFYNEIDTVRMCVTYCRYQNQQNLPNTFRETLGKEISDSLLFQLLETVTMGCIEENKQNSFLGYCRRAFIGEVVERFHFELSKYRNICLDIDNLLLSYGKNISNLEIAYLPKHILQEIDKIAQGADKNHNVDVSYGEVGTLHSEETAKYTQAEKESPDCISINLPRSLYNMLLPYQRQALVFAIEKCDGRVYIADDMGLGKTLEAISLSLHYSSHWPLLIITPSSLKQQWKTELEKWIPFLRSAFSDHENKADACTNYLQTCMKESKIIIIDKASDASSYFNIEIGKQRSILVYIISYSLASILVKELKHANFDIVICDEAHYLKGQDAKRSKAIREIVCESTRLILLSGTPALSRPLEMYQQIDLLLKGKRRVSFKEYAERYCIEDKNDFIVSNQSKASNKLQYARKHLSPKVQYYISKKDMYSGHSNLDELRWFLQKTCLIRRTKSEVINHLLPAKKRWHVILQISPENRRALNKQATERISRSSHSNEQTLHRWLTQSSNENSQNSHCSEVTKMDQKKTETIQLFYETAMMKMHAVSSYLYDYLSHCFVQDNDKIVIFAHHTEMLNCIESTINSVRLKEESKASASQSSKFNDFDPIPTSKETQRSKCGKFEYIRIDGTTPISTRVVLIELFQTQSTYKIALCSLLAVGVGVNFCAAKTCIFAELYWTPAVLIQAEDRIHRLGQKGGGNETKDTAISSRSVEIQYLIAQGTYDDTLWPLIQKKFAIMSKMLESTRGRMSYMLKEKKR